MKCPNCLRLFGPFAIAIGLMVIPLYGQNLPGTQPQKQQQQTQDMQAQAKGQQETISVAGTVKTSSGKVVVEDPSTGVSYIVDNPNKVQQFEGKNVEVTGVLDPTTNTLHVISVKPGK